MSLLICKFASPQSKPEKIERWIAYLDDLKHDGRTRPDDQALVNGLKAEAQRWLVGA